MNRPRFRKILADLWSYPVRSVLVVASITVGLFAIGVITTMHIVLTRDMATGFAAVNPANVRLRASPLTPGIVDHMEEMEGVQLAEGARHWNARLESAPGEWIQVEIHAIPDLGETRIDRLTLLRGHWPTEENEVAIDRYKLPDTNAMLGDSFRLELPSGTIRELQLTAVVQDQTIGSTGIAAGFFIAPVQIYVDIESANWLEQPDVRNELRLVVTGDRTNEDRLLQIGERARDELESIGVEVFSLATRSPLDHPNHPFVDALVVVLLILGALVLFLSGFLITNTLQALLAQQQEQIGIMKTVGGNRLQIISLYMGLILAFGILAFLLAAPLAHLVAYELAEFLATEINFELQGHRIIPLALAVQAGLALLVPQIAASIPIWHGSRISVREALSGFQLGKLPTLGGFSRWLTGLSRLSRPTLISLRNVFRNRARLILTLTTLSLGGAMFIATFNVRVSLQQHSVNISRYFLADVNVSLTRPQRIIEVDQVVTTIAGVERVEGWAAASGELVLNDGTLGERAQILGPPADSQLVEPILQSGRWIQPGDQNAITLNEQFTQSYPGLEVGDSIQLQIDGEKVEWQVVGLYQMAGSSGGLLAYANQEHLAELTGQQGRATEFRVVAREKGLDRAEQEALGRQIEAALEARGIQVREVNAGAWLSEISSEGFGILTALLLFLAILTALVGSIGLAGTLSLNVMERNREIGVMRAIGASNKILIRMVLIEGLTMGFLSWLAGSLLAIPVSKLMADSVSLAIFDTPSTFGWSFIGFGLWMITVALLSAIASTLPAMSASRLTIREVLAHE